MRVHLMAQETAEIRLRAERKAGEVLILMEVKGERRGQGGDQKSKTHDEPLILADLGESSGIRRPAGR